MDCVVGGLKQNIFGPKVDQKLDYQLLLSTTLQQNVVEVDQLHLNDMKC